MNWEHSSVIALASSKCKSCAGLGLVLKADGTASDKACICVVREVFKVCHRRFRDCVMTPKHMTTTSFTQGKGGTRKIWGRKTEEFIADFMLVSKRALGDACSIDQAVFKFHFLLGADWKLVCQQMRIDRQHFYSVRDRVIMRLGRAYGDTEPFCLYPLEEYFGNVAIGGDSVKASLVPEGARFQTVATWKPARRHAIAA
jgi:hypothetical protein